MARVSPFMIAQPIIFALANPTPEISPEDARAVAPEAIIARAGPTIPTR